MRTIIIFESYEGQTRRIVERVAERVHAAGGSVGLFDASQQTAPLRLNTTDRVILAAPVHERRHPKNFELLVATSLEDLAAVPTLMLSVSLKAAFPEGRDEAQDFLDEMKMRTGFTPDRELLVAGAIRSDNYDYYQRQIVQHVLLHNVDVDVSDGPREFTDWLALRDAVDGFLAEASGGGSVVDLETSARGRVERT
ncbi:flavodoxin domain-containing protein [Palleronia pelagia]|uniref:Menaquinone-dependent protoporphyrinogen oxidase n=1 Tax=Palleronia pelagia TaxID=387096 RepID=A0A1H8FSP1_9RHOB|nr:flavodoxin domain-containing protein [Palleronia pelagia]SEN34753.1 menaquinone-dependent protoporphyrinogen oxidase [Palleronia pelagia]